MVQFESSHKKRVHRPTRKAPSITTFSVTVQTTCVLVSNPKTTFMFIMAINERSCCLMIKQKLKWQELDEEKSVNVKRVKCWAQISWCCCLGDQTTFFFLLSLHSMRLCAVMIRRWLHVFIVFSAGCGGGDTQNFIDLSEHKYCWNGKRELRWSVATFRNVYSFKYFFWTVRPLVHWSSINTGDILKLGSVYLTNMANQRSVCHAVQFCRVSFESLYSSKVEGKKTVTKQKLSARIFWKEV